MRCIQVILATAFLASCSPVQTEQEAAKAFQALEAGFAEEPPSSAEEDALLESALEADSEAAVQIGEGGEVTNVGGEDEVVVEPEGEPGGEGEGEGEEVVEEPAEPEAVDPGEVVVDAGGDAGAEGNDAELLVYYCKADALSLEGAADSVEVKAEGLEAKGRRLLPRYRICKMAAALKGQAGRQLIVDSVDVTGAAEADSNARRKPKMKLFVRGVAARLNARGLNGPFAASQPLGLRSACGAGLRARMLLLMAAPRRSSVLVDRIKLAVRSEPCS